MKEIALLDAVLEPLKFRKVSSQLQVSHIFYISLLVYHQGVESGLDCAPPLEKFLTFPEVTYISAQHCVFSKKFPCPCSSGKF